MKKFRIYYPYYFVMMSVMSISAPFALDFAPRRPYACDLAYSCLTAALIISLLPPRDEDFRSYDRHGRPDICGGMRVISCSTIRHRCC